jgi:hypothetical protein
MTITIDDLNKQIAELTAQRDELIKERRNEGVHAWAEWKPALIWSVVPIDKYHISVKIRLTDKSREEYECLFRNYPDAYNRREFPESKDGIGMDFIFFENFICSAPTGGYVVLNVDRYGVDLTQEQADALRAGFVPDDLKNEYYK